GRALPRRGVVGPRRARDARARPPPPRRGSRRPPRAGDRRAAQAAAQDRRRGDRPRPRDRAPGQPPARRTGPDRAADPDHRTIQRPGNRSAQIGNRLTALARTSATSNDLSLLDALLTLGDILADAPASIQARLFAAFGLEL